jgi:hypothetical protein
VTVGKLKVGAVKSGCAVLVIVAAWPFWAGVARAQPATGDTARAILDMQINARASTPPPPMSGAEASRIEARIPAVSAGGAPRSGGYSGAPSGTASPAPMGQ